MTGLIDTYETRRRDVREALAVLVDAKPSELHDDHSLEQHGVDSLDCKDIVFRLEDRFQVRVDDRRLDNAKTIGDVIRLFI